MERSLDLNRSVVTTAIGILIVFAIHGADSSRSDSGIGTREQQVAANIVLVTCDSLDGRLTFSPQNQTVKLPNINFMKGSGAVFLNAYSNSPICCPSRAALWSGRFVHLTESWNNYKCLNHDYPTWMKILQKYGYYTKVYGKTDYTSGHHSVSNRVEAWTRDVKFLLRQEGRPTTVLTGNESTVRVMDHDWQNVDEATKWIRHKATQLDQPFVLSLGLNLPHPYPTPSMGEACGGSTFKTSPYWLKRVKYHSIRIPKWLAFSEMHPVDFYSSYTKNCTGNFTNQDILDIRSFYYAMCAETDLMLGEILTALHDTGLENNTYVIFTSDHGELAMEHRQFYKMSMYEGSSHVPLLMIGPGISGGQQISNLVSLVDIYPTLLDIAGIPVPGNISGYSLFPLLKGFEEEVSVKKLRPDWIFSEFHGCNVNASTYMIRSGHWKYVAYADGITVPSQLFDLSADPDELKNVATKYLDVTSVLDKKLRSILNYPEVSKTVHQYNKLQFVKWKRSLGKNYTDVIANLRWHEDWQKDPATYENAIKKWLYSPARM
ncbi:arylsulfatase K isoform X1 [Hemiscyllium ocellatum]|uniref:arylsulfatase K isoform X1 n=1 Tax=Hemiscyllium ocellatum TaxID=170820 RepID=UPI0029674775|nr:arylsulfatase K isoform X1 [Hemiscyllium ocellatum]